MDVCNKFNARLTALTLMILSCNGFAAVESNNFYSSSADVKVNWNIKAQNLDVGNGITLKVPPNQFQAAFKVAKSDAGTKQAVACYAKENSSTYSIHLKSLPSIFHDFTNNMFINWSGTESDLSSSFTPILDNASTQIQSDSCKTADFGPKNYKIDHMTITKNGENYAYLNDVKITRYYELNGSTLNANFEMTAQDVYVAYLDKHYTNTSFKVQMQNLNLNEIRYIMDNPYKSEDNAAANGKILFLIGKLPNIINQNSNATWMFNTDSTAGHTKINGNINLHKLVDNSFKLANFTDITLNMLTGDTPQDVISITNPLANAIQGEVIAQTTKAELQDAFKLMLKSSLSLQDAESKLVVNKASAEVINEKTSDLLEYLTKYNLINIEKDNVKFEYKFQNSNGDFQLTKAPQK